MWWVSIAVGLVWLLSLPLGRLLRKWLKRPEPTYVTANGQRLARLTRAYDPIFRVVGGLLWIGTGLAQRFSQGSAVVILLASAMILICVAYLVAYAAIVYGKRRT